MKAEELIAPIENLSREVDALAGMVNWLTVRLLAEQYRTLAALAASGAPMDVYLSIDTERIHRYVASNITEILGAVEKQKKTDVAGSRVLRSARRLVEFLEIPPPGSLDLN